MIRTEERGEGSACNFALSVTGLDRQQAAKDMTYETTVPMLAWPITSDSPAHKLQPRRARAKLHARECIGRLWQRWNTPGSAYVRTHAVQPKLGVTRSQRNARTTCFRADTLRYRANRGGGSQSEVKATRCQATRGNAGHRRPKGTRVTFGVPLGPGPGEIPSCTTGVSYRADRQRRASVCAASTNCEATSMIDQSSAIVVHTVQTPNVAKAAG